MAFEDGTAEITLGDEKISLACSVQAARAVSRDLGGFAPAFQRLSNLDQMAFEAVIRAGWPGDEKPPKDLDERIWRQGLASLVPSLVVFLGMLANGGRVVAADTEAPKDASGKNVLN
jgi:hypothetical protein